MSEKAASRTSVHDVVRRPLSWKVHAIRGSVFGVATDRGTCVGVGSSPSSAISQAVAIAQLRGVAVDFVDGGEASDGFVQLMAAWFHSYKGKLPPKEYTTLDFVFGVRSE